MTQPFAFRVDPEDPRAPTEEQWDAMTPDQRARVVASLPADVPFELFMPEGDAHRLAKQRTVGALDSFFKKIGRKVYLSSELAVYYPGERRFAPDVLAVLDVEPHERMKWVVAHEGKGLDLVLEVHVSGEWEKDFEANRKRYARLGIPEYFLFDRTSDRLFGWRLSTPDGRVYEALVPQLGRYTSRVLGLDLAMEGDRIRFYFGTAPLPEAEELVAKLETMVDDLVRRREEEQHDLARERRERERAEQERERAEQERERAEQERERAEQERQAAQRRVEELEAELATLRAPK
ncbi:MAG: Uma2 family endonuclease [Polyangiaceae bacterium]|jgi:Uma2 family endonuclease|nr:Uma2 family endonuclease [Polyangiaceae bacterium]